MVIVFFGECVVINDIKDFDLADLGVIFDDGIVVDDVYVLGVGIENNWSVCVGV